MSLKFNLKSGVMLLILNDCNTIDLAFGRFQLNYQSPLVSYIITIKGARIKTF
jgi:hypothetical protein